jgi:GT2 family glycosyltransferase
MNPEAAVVGVVRLAVIMTCHNRREGTLRCLEALHAQEGLEGRLRFRVFLLDDGSSDGTGEAVQAGFPEVRLVWGDGHCYWAGGMRRAWKAAAVEDVDASLWLNDDTFLDGDALARLLDLHLDLRLSAEPGILVGTTRDPATGQPTYGGHRQASSWRPLRLSLIAPGPARLRCDTFNGNCVWIPRGVEARLGGLGEAFVHTMADIDYGFTARRHGIPAWVIPGTVGTCSLNAPAAAWQVPGLRVADRWRKVRDPKGLPPRAWMRFALRNGGWLGPLLALFPYVKALLPQRPPGQGKTRI